MGKVYRERDAKITALKRKTVAIVGYGIQGRAHALCLRDTGIKVVAAELEGTPAWKNAEADGTPVMSAALIALLRCKTCSIRSEPESGSS